MTTLIDGKYMQFQYALILSPDYMGIPSKSRPACVRFVSIAAKLTCKSPPDPEELEGAYGPALEEARRLVAEGLLTVQLPDSNGDPRSEKTQDETVPLSEVSDGEGGPSQHSDYTEATATDPLEGHKIHPAAAIFPLMDDEALDELASDIKQNGLQQPIVRHRDEVVDGRNRLIACLRAGVEPTFIEWTGKGSVVVWIVSINLHRRHLTNQQRAMIAAKVAEVMALEGKKRSAQNLRNSGGPVENLNPGTRAPGSSAETAARLLNVSKDATAKAKTVIKKGSTKLVEAVTAGKVSLDAASKVANLPQKKQDDVIEKGKVQQAAKAIRDAKKAASKNTSKKVDDADKAQDPVPVTTREVVPEPAAPKPQAKLAVEPKPVEVDESKSSLSADSEALQLLQQVHDDLKALVASGVAAGQTAKVEDFLRAVITYIERYRAKLG